MSEWSDVFTEVSRAVQPDLDPVLSKGDGTTADPTKELDQTILSSARGVKWSASLPLTYGQVVLPTVSMGRRFRVTKAGTTGSSEPAWPDTDKATVTDGTVTLVEDGFDYGLYDKRRAKYGAWNLKAAKAAERISFSADGRTLQAQQLFDHCQMMAKQYVSVGIS